MSSISLFSMTITNSNAAQSSQAVNKPKLAACDNGSGNAFEQLISSLTSMANGADAANNNSGVITASSFSFNPLGADGSSSTNSDPLGDFVNKLIAMLQDIGQSDGQHHRRHHRMDDAEQLAGQTPPVADAAAGDASAASILSI